MTGTVHAREFVSFTTHIFLIARIIYLFEHNDKNTIDLLKRTNLYFIPLLNIDGLQTITDNFTRRRKIIEIRKNQNPSYSLICSQETLGVDLNRNFAVGFGGFGSSNNPCDEEYRGPNAFSEPETNTVKNFVDSHPNIKFSIDYHAYGDDYIIPSQLSMKTIFNTPYEEFYKEAGLYSTHKMGSSEDLLQYTTSGDVSDWMYGEKAVFAISVEVGSEYSFTPAILRVLNDLQYFFQIIIFQ